MPWLRALVLVAAVGLSLASTLDPGEGAPPDPDSCAGATASGATAVTLGHAGEPFAAMADMDAAEIIAGTQGSDMLPLRLRVEGLDANCVSQLTEIRDASGVIATSNIGLATYPDGEGRVTMDHYLILGAFIETGAELTVSTTAGGATASVVLVAP